jgi:arylsulfatase A-like enzyme
MPRLSLLLAAAFLLASCGHPTRPNIIFIFSDDHSAAAISAYGSAINRTPNIDRIANEGVRLDRFLVTNSICAPSRATILTGLYSHANGQITNGETFDGSQQTFPKLLQRAGYQTAMIGKWHLRSTPTGFDYSNVLIGQGPYYNPRMILNGTDTLDHVGYTTDIVTDAAIDWLDNLRDRGKPFIAMVQHKAPHRPWDPGPEYLSTFDDVEIAEPATFRDNYATRSSAAAAANMRVATNLVARDLKIEGPGNLTPEQQATWDKAYGPKNESLRAAQLTGDELVRWKYQRYIKDYLRAVQSMDDNIGRLLDHLDESGLADNTVVIYSSDQGWYLGEHGWYDKRWMFEPSLRAPLVARWPGRIAPGSSSSALTSNVDLAATFLDIAGAPAPAGTHGTSLVPILTTQAEPEGWRSSFYYHYYEYPGSHCVQRHYGVRTDRHKLIYYYEIDEWELFDLDSDPDEVNNRYGEPELDSLVVELKAELERLRAELDVPVDARPMVECTSDSEGWFGFE